MPKTKKVTKSATRPPDYFPDLDQWPNNWTEIKEDLKIGHRLLALFILFIQHLIDEELAKKTIKNHGTQLGILGGENYPETKRDRRGKSKVITKKADPALCRRSRPPAALILGFQ
jgi:hypothetical protein